MKKRAPAVTNAKLLEEIREVQGRISREHERPSTIFRTLSEIKQATNELGTLLQSVRRAVTVPTRGT